MIGDVAALLLVLGLTGPLLQPLLQIKVDRPAAPADQPGPALSLWALNFYLWHLPALYGAAYRNELIHAGQHLTFLSSAP